MNNIGLMLLKISLFFGYKSLWCAELSLKCLESQKDSKFYKHVQEQIHKRKESIDNTEYLMRKFH